MKACGSAGGSGWARLPPGLPSLPLHTPWATLETQCWPTPASVWSRSGGRPQWCVPTSPNSPSSEQPPPVLEAFHGVRRSQRRPDPAGAQPPPNEVESEPVQLWPQRAWAHLRKKDCLMQGARRGVPVLTAITPPFYAWQPPAGPQGGASPGSRLPVAIWYPWERSEVKAGFNDHDEDLLRE